MNSAEVCLLPDNRAQGFPLDFTVFCFLLLKKDKQMHLTTILYTSLRDHTLFFSSVKSTLWLSGGTEAETSVDGKSEIAFASGPSWGTVPQKTQAVSGTHSWWGYGEMKVLSCVLSLWITGSTSHKNQVLYSLPIEELLLLPYAINISFPWIFPIFFLTGLQAPHMGTVSHMLSEHMPHS